MSSMGINLGRVRDRLNRKTLDLNLHLLKIEHILQPYTKAPQNIVIGVTRMTPKINIVGLVKNLISLPHVNASNIADDCSPSRKPRYQAKGLINDLKRTKALVTITVVVKLPGAAINVVNPISTQFDIFCIIWHHQIVIGLSFGEKYNLYHTM